MSENLNRSFDDLTVVDSFCPTENISTLEECLKRIQILEAQNCSTSNNISQNNKSDNFTIFQQMQGRIQSLTEKNYELQIQQLQLALIEEKKKYDELKLQIENQQGGSNSLENETFNCHSNEGINILRNEIKLLRDEKAMDVEKFKEEIEKVRNEAKDKIEELIQEVNNLKTHAQQTELENTNVQQNVQENTEEIRSVDDNQFVGNWKLIETDNFKDYLKEVGVGLFTRTGMNALMNVLEFEVNGDLWKMTSNSSFTNWFCEFKLGEEKEQVTADARKLKSTFIFVGGKLIEEQKKINFYDKDSYIEHYVGGDGKLVIEYESGGIKAIRKYEKM